MCAACRYESFNALILSQLTRLSAEQTRLSEVAKEQLWPRVPFLQGFLPQQREYRPLRQAKDLGAPQVLDALGWNEDLKGQTSAARGYGRFSHRIKGNGRKGQARISSKGALKLSYMDDFFLSQEPWKCWKKLLKGLRGWCGRQLQTLNPRHLEGAKLVLQSGRQGLCSSAAGKAGMPTGHHLLQPWVAYRDDAQFLTFKVLSDVLGQFWPSQDQSSAASSPVEGRRERGEAVAPKLCQQAHTLTCM